MGNDLPPKPKLADPASTARQTKSGGQQRDRPIYSQGAGSREDFTQWEVDVTPLLDTTHTGRGIDSGRLRPRAVFEVRAAYYGPGLAAFGRQPNTRMIPTTHTEDRELALMMARAMEARLRRGERDLGEQPWKGLEEDVKRRRA